MNDVRASARVQVRIKQLAAGNPGDALLAGGDRCNQRDDVHTALRLARNL